jgi:hypothetical protein
MITTQVLVILTAIAVTMSLWILDLVRREKLYPGYGIVLIPTIAAAVPVAGVADLLNGPDRAIALTLLAVLCLAVLLIYMLSQVTIVANRVTRVVQEMALEQAARREALPQDDRG